MNDTNKLPKGETYWTNESIRKIRIYPATAKLHDEWCNNPDSAIWPVYDTSGYSTEAVECKDKDAAYCELLLALNNDIYAELHDI